MNRNQRFAVLALVVGGFGVWSLPALGHTGQAHSTVGNPHAPVSAAPEFRTGYYQGRLVTYEVRGNLAIYQGDIVLGTVAEMESRLQPDGAGVAFANRLWPLVSGVRQVPYTIQEDGGGVVPGSVNAFNAQFAGLIQFVPRNAENDYVNFYLPASNQGGTCFSFVGRIGGKQDIGGSSLCDQSVILHEMGHSIGLWHEQSRQDRNAYVTVNYGNIDDQYVNNFNQEVNEDDLGLYDYGSTMHYAPFSFSVNGAPTIETIPHGILIKEGGGFSAGDVDGVKRLYGAAPNQVSVTSNPPGLQVSVDGTSCATPCGPFTWALGSSHTLDVPTHTQAVGGTTYTYGRWNSNTAVSHTITVAPGDGRRTHPGDRPAVTVYSANFRRLWPFSVQTIGNGTVATNPNPQAYPPVAGNFYVDRTLLTLTATPGAGSNFYNFFGVPSPIGANPKTFYVTFAMNPVQAVFVTDPLTTIATNPPGLRVDVDGNSTIAPRRFGEPNNDPGWTNGSTHTVNAPSPQTPSGTQNTRYTFQSWSDGGAQQHTITHTNANQTITANYTTEYMVRTGVAGFPCQGTVTPVTGFQPAGTQVQFQANPNPGWFFVGWTGDLTGTENPKPVTVNDQIRALAEFNTVAAPLRITSLSPASRTTGSGAFTLTINGSGFTNDTVVFVNNAFQPSTTVNANQLTVDVPADVVATAGAVPVTVQNTANGCPVQAGSKFQVVTSNPTAVTVSSFGAGATASGARVTWRTAAETGLVGFNVWRRAGSKGRYVKLNAWLIAATGGIAGGHRYSFRDARVRPGRTYYYRLETVATGGARRWVGPAKVTILR